MLQLMVMRVRTAAHECIQCLIGRLSLTGEWPSNHVRTALLPYHLDPLFFTPTVYDSLIELGKVKPMSKSLFFLVFIVLHFPELTDFIS